MSEQGFTPEFLRKMCVDKDAKIERMRNVIIDLLGDVMATQRFYPSERRESLIKHAQAEAGTNG